MRRRVSGYVLEVYQLNTTQTLFTPGEHKTNLKGPAGQLETIISCPESFNTDYMAIICHPHSLHGGTMTNKVVTTLAKACSLLSLCSVRFNFRGVGNSDGKFDHGKGETEDLLAVEAWLQQAYPNAKIILAGFSFGSYVAYRAAAQCMPAQLISIAPPVVNFQFDGLPIPDCPWLLVQGEQDEVVSSDAVFAWGDTLPSTATMVRVPNASHFFHGKLIDLRHIVMQFMQTHLAYYEHA